MPDSGDVTRNLQRLSLGDSAAEDSTYRALYSSLRRIAFKQLRLERPGHSLQPTLLVNEVYLDLVKQTGKVWDSRAHFLAVASFAMRRVLVDYARQHNTQKRGGEVRHEPIDERVCETVGVAPGVRVDIMDLERALGRLEELDPRQARLVEYRFYGGMSEEEAAAMLGVSIRTIRRDWNVARAWLYGQLHQPLKTPPQARAAHASSGPE